MQLISTHPNINQALKQRKEYWLNEETKKGIQNLLRFYNDRGDTNAVKILSRINQAGKYNGEERDILNEMRAEYIKSFRGRVEGII